jgi:hypothetical protein
MSDALSPMTKQFFGAKGEIAERLVHETSSGFSAATVVVGAVRADVEGVDVDTLGIQQLA